MGESRLTCSFKLPKKNHQPLIAKITMVFCEVLQSQAGGARDVAPGELRGVTDK